VILPNIYGASSTTAASATLCYSIGPAAKPPESWTDTGKPGPQPHPVLSAISVFDSDCAAVHLKGPNHVAFRPFGLDVPDELGAACKQVKALLDMEKKPAGGGPQCPFHGTALESRNSIGKALAALTHKTDVALLEKLASLSDQEQARLTRLTEDLPKNPATAAAEQKLEADRNPR
jgi:hypothetical protein